MKFCFSEFDWVLSENSWDSIKKLAHASHDQSILLAMIDDWDFLTRSYKKHGYYYFAKMPISFSKNDYEAVLTQEIGPNEDENILTLAIKIVILPNSLRWMIYGERETELSVLGFNSSMKYQDEGWLQLFPLHFLIKRFLSRLKKNCFGIISDELCSWKCID